MRRHLLPSLLQSRQFLYKYFKPHTDNLITYSQLKQIKQFSSNNKKEFNNENTQSSPHNLAGSIKTSYKIFNDKDAEIIFDVSEKREAINLEDLNTEEEYYNPYEGINLERGVNGVFEIEDLVLLLQKEKAKNIFVASVPPELSYVDYMVVVTGKSGNHMNALASFVRKVYKLKRYKTDLIPKIEGKDTKDWIALDLGNIALHIFSESNRLLYDLETLWSLGPEYDNKNKDESENLMDQYNAFLSNMEPIEKNDKKSNKTMK